MIFYLGSRNNKATLRNNQDKVQQLEVIVKGTHSFMEESTLHTDAVDLTVFFDYF